MKTFFAAVCLIAFCAASCQTTQAIRSNELIEAVLDQQVPFTMFCIIYTYSELYCGPQHSQKQSLSRVILHAHAMLMRASVICGQILFLPVQNQHGLLESFTSLLGVHDKPLSEKKAYTLIK